MRKNILNNQDGRLSLKASFILLLIGLGIHVGTVYIPPYLDFMLLKEKLNSEANLSHMYYNSSLIKRIIREADTWNMDLTRENFQIDRTDGTIYISVQYDYVFETFGGNYIYNHVFFYEVEEDIKAGGYLQHDRGY